MTDIPEAALMAGAEALERCLVETEGEGFEGYARLGRAEDVARAVFLAMSEKISAEATVATKSENHAVLTTELTDAVLERAAVKWAVADSEYDRSIMASPYDMCHLKFCLRAALRDLEIGE